MVGRYALSQEERCVRPCTIYRRFGRNKCDVIGHKVESAQMCNRFRAMFRCPVFSRHASKRRTSLVDVSTTLPRANYTTRYLGSKLCREQTNAGNMDAFLIATHMVAPGAERRRYEYPIDCLNEGMWIVVGLCLYIIALDRAVRRTRSIAGEGKSASGLGLGFGDIGRLSYLI